MEALAQRRLLSDLKHLQQDSPTGISAAPTEDLLVWNAVIIGPQDTPYENGTFKLKMIFPPEYPNKPPHIEFKSEMYHPNVFANGLICLDILGDRWTPALDVSSILVSIQSLLSEPNTQSPANLYAAYAFLTDQEDFKKKVNECVEKSLLD